MEDGILLFCIIRFIYLKRVFKYLNGCDVISFALTCKRFSSLSQSVTHLNLENGDSSLGKSLPLVSSFFDSHLNPSLLSSCNLNGCYWITVSTLKTFLIRCIDLEELHVAETNLSIRDLVIDILPKCSKVTKLSFTLKIGDWLLSAAHLGNQKQPTLCRLKSVEIIVADPNDSNTRLSETIAFLRSCENVEEITVCKLRLSGLDRVNSRTLFHNPNILKSVVFVAEPTGVIVDRHQAPFQFSDVIEGSNLTTFWCNLLRLQNSNMNNLTSMALPLIRDQVSLPLNVLHPGLRLGHLESYWEPAPILMKSVLNSPTKLKLISCFYSNDHDFNHFCQNHPLVEVLKLGIWINRMINNRRDPAMWNMDPWKYLARLRILSLQPVLIRNGGEQSMPYLSSIIESCPLIQELEIMEREGSHRLSRITGEDLSSIALLGTTLKRLTLANFHVKDGLFLEDILKSCSKLESLRLKMIGPTEELQGYSIDGSNHISSFRVRLGPPVICCYATNLITVLPLAKNLKTFCLFQTNVPQMELLLDSLESCTSISQLSLVCPSSLNSFSKNISKEDFTSRMLRLCEKMSHLVALFCYFRVPVEHCEEAKEMLKKRFQTERPAFRADVQSEIRRDLSGDGRIYDSYPSKEFPVMYNDLLTSCQSRVALVPFNCNTFLRRTY